MTNEHLDPIKKLSGQIATKLSEAQDHVVNRKFNFLKHTATQIRSLACTALDVQESEGAHACE